MHHIEFKVTAGSPAALSAWLRSVATTIEVRGLPNAPQPGAVRMMEGPSHFVLTDADAEGVMIVRAPK